MLDTQYPVPSGTSAANALWNIPDPLVIPTSHPLLSRLLRCHRVPPFL